MDRDLLTPRRALIWVGLVLLGFGVLGFFVDWDQGPLHLTLGKRVAFIALGLFVEWVAEVLTSEIKRPITKVLAIAMLAAGVTALFVTDWGFTSAGRPWEALVYMASGLVLGLSAWWPARFRDYEWATGWSSGLEGSSRVTPYR